MIALPLPFCPIFPLLFLAGFSNINKQKYIKKGCGFLVVGVR